MAKGSKVVRATPAELSRARNESSRPDAAAARLAAINELLVGFGDEEWMGLTPKMIMTTMKERRRLQSQAQRLRRRPR
ncbi:hypothetical protein PC121_g21279 [Phytophthora cactorum]|nr:hypothetical protein PC120_g21581 [Phytophthora cactorum]KAG3045422.1 hypothetical protein PC121_g21279 [Phytophthora cactorum]